LQHRVRRAFPHLPHTSPQTYFRYFLLGYTANDGNLLFFQHVDAKHADTFGSIHLTEGTTIPFIKLHLVCELIGLDHVVISSSPYPLLNSESETPPALVAPSTQQTKREHDQSDAGNSSDNRSDNSSDDRSDRETDIVDDSDTDASSTPALTGSQKLYYIPSGRHKKMISDSSDRSVPIAHSTSHQDLTSASRFKR
jgi:hypothetical protein